MLSADSLKNEVSRRYAEKLGASECCCDDGCDCECGGDPYGEGLYPVEVIREMPAGAVSFGCGNPVALAALQLGETVLDLGSGAGRDCLMAAKQVGPGGLVIGVDFTREMIDRATQNAAKLGLANVSFRLGDIEALPVQSESVDTVISNCVINLAPDKDAVFAEAFRVLRPGGRLMVSDIVLTRPATGEEMQDMALLTGCVSGSLPASDYAAKVEGAGFRDVQVSNAPTLSDEVFWYSASISAMKP